MIDSLAISKMMLGVAYLSYPRGFARAEQRSFERNQCDQIGRNLAIWEKNIHTKIRLRAGAL
jgi:hypothetical protein